MMNISIDVCSGDHLESLSPLFDSLSRQTLFLSQRNRSSASQSGFAKKFTRVVRYPLARLFVASMAGEVQGFALYRRLPWDSEIFGVECARLESLGGLGNYEVSLRSKRALLGAIGRSDAELNRDLQLAYAGQSPRPLYSTCP